MKHSGLQKSISSIFDGNEPIKQETTSPAVTAAQPKPVFAATAKPLPVIPAVTTPVTAAAAPTAPAAVQTAAAAQVTAPQATRPATRPRPVPKKSAAGQNTVFIKDVWKTIKGQLTGNAKGKLDARQKKALILGIFLAVVFAVVLMFALGSGPSGAKAASKKGDKENSPAAIAKSGSTENWQKPEIYPLTLRDPMKPSSNAQTDNQTEGEMTVRGIVYSSLNPSAIIANQIVYEGDVILGVKIIKIEKDFVAFEKDGKQWQQQVRQ